MTKHLEVLEEMRADEVSCVEIYATGTGMNIQALDYAISIIKQHEAISEAISVERIEKIIIDTTEIYKGRKGIANFVTSVNAVAQALHKELLGGKDERNL